MAPARQLSLSLRTGLALPLACLSVMLSGCFDSDELRGSQSNDSSIASDTVTPYNDDTDDGGDDNWTAEETGEPDITCRDAIECMVGCQAQALLNQEPEPDLSCFADCDQGLNTDEAYLLIKLGECIGNQCSAMGACGGEATDTDCLICIAGLGNDPLPPGCEEEAALCI